MAILGAELPRKRAVPADDNQAIELQPAATRRIPPPRRLARRRSAAARLSHAAAPQRHALLMAAPAGVRARLQTWLRARLPASLRSLDAWHPGMMVMGFGLDRAMVACCPGSSRGAGTSGLLLAGLDGGARWG